MGRLLPMDPRERHAILGQGATKAETPKERRLRQALEADLEGSPVRGRPIQRRLRNFRPAEQNYLAALGGPLPWMRRLRQIKDALEQHGRRLEEAWRELAAASGDDTEGFAERWRAIAG